MRAGAALLALVFVRGPYVQDVRRNSAVVMWETDVAAAGEVVLVADAGGEWRAATPATRVHEARVAGLAPATRYRYRVRAGGVESPEGAFVTAPPPHAPFTFVVYGDCRSDAEAHAAVVERIAAEPAEFLLHTGDLVYDGASDRDWQQFFEIERDLLRDRALYPAVGNHDLAWGSADRFRAYFSLPDDSPDPEQYYAFTWGSARFLVLDSSILFYAIDRQTAWLETELAAAAGDPAVRHIFVALHHGPYATGPHGGNQGARAAWSPLFVRYGVDAVFSGHDHTYERLAADGVRYIVTGGAGAPPYPQDPAPAAEDALASLYYEAGYHFLRVHVAGERVEIAAVRADGSTIESVEFRAPERPREPPRVATRPDATGRRSVWPLAAIPAVLVALAGVGLFLVRSLRTRR